MKHYVTPHKEFFNWIYNRLVHIYGEDPDYDYMQSLRERIDELFNDETAKGKEEPKMSRDAERIIKMLHPDGYKEGTPYWILPNDRITYNYNEWLEADKAYWGDEKTEER